MFASLSERFFISISSVAVLLGERNYMLNGVDLIADVVVNGFIFTSDDCTFPRRRRPPRREDEVCTLDEVPRRHHRTLTDGTSCLSWCRQ